MLAVSCKHHTFGSMLPRLQWLPTPLVATMAVRAKAATAAFSDLLVLPVPYVLFFHEDAIFSTVAR